MIGNKVQNFQEKPEGDNAWINGGFFVLERSIKYIKDDLDSFEVDILPQIANDNLLYAYISMKVFGSQWIH